uniref:TadE/TadG family type IV pilus assembly protein n=1 Tax=Dialister sp. TaxID=1955814 RepID=UPI004027CAE8
MTFLNRLLSRIKNERGAYMVFFAILIPILFGCAGLAVDLGNGFARHARLQKAADAAVLAAAYVYDKDDVTDLKTVAHTYLEANLYADTAMRDNYKIDKITKRVYGDGTDETKGVLLSLYASQNVDTTFMRILGLQKIPVSVEATARLVPDSPITGDPGVFGFTMVAGYSGPVVNSWDLDKNAIYIKSCNVYIHGKIHSNGPISIDHNNIEDKRSVFIEKGAFSSSVQTDLDLWSNRQPPGDQDPGSGAHFNRFGYYDGTSQGQDVLASNTYVDKMINIAMEKDNSSVEKVYQYVEKYRNEFPPTGGLYRKDESSCKSGEESIYLDTDGHYDSAGSGRGFSENDKQYKIIITDGDITVKQGNCNTSWTNMTIISLHGNVTVNANEMNDRFKAIIYAPNGDVLYYPKVDFEGSIVAKHIFSDVWDRSFYWNPFQFGDSGVKQVKLHSNEDKDYSGIEISI